MAGGYFDLPVSSKRAGATDNAPGTADRSPASGAMPSSTSIMAQGKCIESLRSQGKPGRASGSKTPSRVKFAIDERDYCRTADRSSSESQLDGSWRLPPKPYPTIGAPVIATTPVLPPSPCLVAVDTDTLVNETWPAYSRIKTLGGVSGDDVSDERRKSIYSVRDKSKGLAFSRGSSSKFLKPNICLSSEFPIFDTLPKDAAPSEDCGKILMNLSEKHKKQVSSRLADEYDNRSTDTRSSVHADETLRLEQHVPKQSLGLLGRIRFASSRMRPKQSTPAEDPDTYPAQSTHYRGGVLSTLLKLYEQPAGGYSENCHGHSRRGSDGELSVRGLSPDPSYRPESRKRWYEKSPSQSSISLAGSTPKNSCMSPIAMLRHTRSSGSIRGMTNCWPKAKLEDEIRITVHIAELLSRQYYLIMLCRALMKYGAPTHRLEEYMMMTARVLEIDSQFLYIPGCMIISFDDTSAHTTEVRVVRSLQGIDLGRLFDVHTIYKEVVHDIIGVEEATQRLNEVMNQKNKFPVGFLIFMHGCASATVGPFAFSSRPIDMPICFMLGCLLGTLQLVLSPRSPVYQNVFEISATILISFLARAFGSITRNGERLFCFSALAQSSIALILPGYIVLCASLELQSRNIVAGSIRMVYAIIYTLFLGFGITIGTAIYGLMDSNATNDYTCPANPIDNEYLEHFPFAMLFTVSLALVNQTKWRQIPAMLVISFCGYAADYFSSKRFESSTQISCTMGAFIIGVVSNLYSRLGHGFAAAAMLPGIFVLVPSGLAASGSLVAGIISAMEITEKQTPYSVVSNGTQGFVDAMNMSLYQSQAQYHGIVLDIGFGMIQVAIGFTVGLFLAVLVVYPLGKKRSGLFSF